MKKFRRWHWILTLSVLYLTVLAPILIVSVGREELISDLSNLGYPIQRSTDKKVKQMKDYVLRGKTYLSMWPPGSNYRLVKELRPRIK
ncbi:hypothetical protein BDE02_02G041600 [Populus trichocarpa]|nr:hypothetical protein BDE02_02G041600 [Populus trichocarpa]